MKIEGRNQITEYIRSGKPIDKVLIEKGAESAGSGSSLFGKIRDKGIKYQFVPKQVLAAESLTGNPQGFIAFAEDFAYCEIEDILAAAEAAGQPPFVVILDGVEDPHNLGSIIRVCECAGAHGLIIPKHRSASVNETAVRVSAGASAHLPVCRAVNLTAVIALLKEKGFWVYGGEMSGSPMGSADLKGSLALVIGGEGQGISRLVKEKCDGLLAIPMRGKVNSLNAAAACAVLVYEAVRQRSNG